LVDTDRLIELQQRLAELDTVEKALRFSTDKQEIRELTKSLKTIRNAVQKIQRNVLSTYKVEYVACRDIGHVWLEKESQVSTKDRTVDRILICDRCTMERHETFTSYGELTSRYYTRPEDYLLSTSVTGFNRYSKQFWRGITYMVASGQAV
jgi:hypothetical protein